MPVKDHYATLGLLPGATNLEVRAAYLRCSKQWHPDRNAGRDTTAMMQAINEAREVLSDPIKRGIYDSSRQQQSAPAQEREAGNNYGYTYTYTYQSSQQQNNNSYHASQQRSTVNKQRFARLKMRTELFSTQDAHLHAQYVKLLAGKTNQELLTIAGQWMKYAIVFIDQVVLELHERRNYDLDTIYSLIKEVKPGPPAPEPVTDWYTVIMRWAIFAILASLANAAGR